ncbi:MAG: sigma-70 family RNA polymerase sigma factor [Actinomycetota bacterium]|nr:sigma-70 family RNA polymerase sigma factor [Actinomycetota bacterium]
MNRRNVPDEPVRSSSKTDGYVPNADIVDLAPVVRPVIRSRVADPETAEELVQETLTRVMEARPRLHDDRLVGYAIVTAKNLVRARASKEIVAERHAHQLLNLVQPEEPEAAVLRQEEQQAVKEAFGRLPPTDKMVLLEHDVKEKDHSTIAQESRSTPGNIAARLARARARLRLEYLLALRRISPPTGKCRSVLLAMATGDRRQQRALNVSQHLGQCSQCSALIEPLLRRRRGLAALFPLAGAGGLLERLRNWTRTPGGQVTGVAAATSILAASFLSSPCPATLAIDDDGPFPLPRVSDLGCYAGKTVQGEQVAVASVPSNEGFWIGSIEQEQIWVAIAITGESPNHILSGQRLSLRGQVVANPPDFIQRFGLSPEEGAERLGQAGYHVVVNPGDLRVLSPP